MSIEQRKKFIQDWSRRNPAETLQKINGLYDLLEEKWPEVTRGGHRGLVNRMQPWNTVAHVCPRCAQSVTGLAEIQEKFGFRRMGSGKQRIQSWCRECRKEGARLKRLEKKAKREAMLAKRAVWAAEVLEELGEVDTSPVEPEPEISETVTPEEAEAFELVDDSALVLPSDDDGDDFPWYEDEYYEDDLMYDDDDVSFFLHQNSAGDWYVE